MDERKAFLTHDGFIVPIVTLKSCLGTRYNEFLSKLTVTYQPKVGQKKHTKLYEERNYINIPCIFLPRGLITPLRKILVIDNLLSPLKKIVAPIQIELYDNQKLVVDHITENIFTTQRIIDGTATAVLNMRAGMGKTLTSAGIISKLGLRTLYVVPRKPLAVQALNDLKMAFYSDNSPKIEQYDQKRKQGDITVIVINSAVECTKEFFMEYSLVILDEVHLYCSEFRRKIFKKASSQVVLGMSATTEDRTDGLDVVFHKELAPDGIIFAEKIPGFTYQDTIFKGTVDIIYYNGPPEYTRCLSHESTGKLFTPYMINQFLEDPFRMKIAVNEIRKLYDWRGVDDQKHCIYVFCEEREPLQLIYKLLCETFDVDAPELKAGEFIGGIKDARIRELKENARILLTTYAYSGTGVSIDKMTAIVFLTPRRAQMKQIIPRILRRGGDLSIERRIIDIVDNKTPMRNQLIDRMNAYTFYGFEKITKKISHDSI